MSKVLAFFEKEETEILNQVDRFERALVHLRYEGKVSWARNVKMAIQAIRGLTQILRMHRTFQEKVIFPYLLTHIPKHESVIQFLRSDHESVRKSKQRLDGLLRKLSLKKPHVQNDKIQELGMCLIYLIRHHIQLEGRSIHKAVRHELSQDEIKDVEKRAELWFSRHKDLIVT